MSTKKTAYYQTYDPSVLEMTEYCVREDMCDDIASLEDDIFEFGQEIVKLSKSLDGLDKSEIASKIQTIAAKHCDCYLEDGDSIANLDEYDGLESSEDYDEDDEDDEDYDEDDEES